MRKKRSMLLAAVTAIAALMLALLPATASAATNAAPEDARSSGAAVLVAEPTLAGPPSGSPCVATTGATACLEQHGDRWWVLDTEKDGASAEVSWENYRNGSLYRSGVCRNSHGYGQWSTCNKNYYEGSTLVWSACVYDASEGVLVRCSAAVSASA